VGWLVRDLRGGLHFSRDVIFNEDLSGRLGVPRPVTSPLPSPEPLDVPTRPIRDRILTVAGHDYEDILRLKEARRIDRVSKRATRVGGDKSQDSVEKVADRNWGAGLSAMGDVPENVVNGGDFGCSEYGKIPATDDLSPSDEVLSDFLSFLAPLPFTDQVETESLIECDADIIRRHLLGEFPALPLPSPTSLLSYDISKPPLSYSEAVARPDAFLWHAAMEREMSSLREMGAFVEEDLPKGQRTIGLK
jgi:hypothetical protein